MYTALVPVHANNSYHLKVALSLASYPGSLGTRLALPLHGSSTGVFSPRFGIGHLHVHVYRDFSRKIDQGGGGGNDM